MFDLGLQSIRALSTRIKEAGTVILNGPAGVFEIPDFALGTIEMLSACAETNGYALMGGGHTATLVSQRGMSDKMGHVSRAEAHVWTTLRDELFLVFMPSS